MIREILPTKGSKPPVIVDRIEFGGNGVEQRIPIAHPTPSVTENRITTLETRMDEIGNKVNRLSTLIEQLIAEK